MLACSHGIRVPLCQIFEVVWMGMGLERLLGVRRALLKPTANRVRLSRRGVNRRPDRSRFDNTFWRLLADPGPRSSQADLRSRLHPSNSSPQAGTSNLAVGSEWELRRSGPAPARRG